MLDIQKILDEKIVIPCETEKDAIEYLEICHEFGFAWVTGRVLLEKKLIEIVIKKIHVINYFHLKVIYTYYM